MAAALLELARSARAAVRRPDQARKPPGDMARGGPSCVTPPSSRKNKKDRIVAAQTKAVFNTIKLDK